MTGYERYSFILCLAVCLMLTAFSVTVLVIFMRQHLRLIRLGDEDEQILRKREYRETHATKIKVERTLGSVLSIALCVLFLLAFLFSFYATDRNAPFIGAHSRPMVVNSPSMAKKHKENAYLFNNDLNDQFNTYDLIMLDPMPKESEIELYDIVAYEIDGIIVLHRVVRIDEPNGEHSERFFLTQGDAVSRPDAALVRYEQMRGIYNGTHVPYLGSVIHFIKSPAGWLCLLAMLMYVLATPILEGILRHAEEKRLEVLRVEAGRITYKFCPPRNPSCRERILGYIDRSIKSKKARS